MAACRMKDIFNHHIPVLLNEAIDNLILSSEGIYIDATFGRGSHSQSILNRLNAKGRLIAIDKDPEAYQYAKENIKDPRFTILHSSFANLQEKLSELNLIEKIDGILFDLGVSSPQLDNPARGFSFMREGALDMRMDTTQGLDAKTWLAQIDEEELANILWKYGEEKYSRRIARAIVVKRKESPITTTSQLTEIIKSASPNIHGFDKHPATRSFQAIRIAINEELTELESALHQSLNVMKVGARLSVISFHSLEDRIVKLFIREHEQGEKLPRNLPIKNNQFTARLKTIGKPIKPSLSEMNKNPRARSAILRIAEKLS